MIEENVLASQLKDFYRKKRKSSFVLGSFLEFILTKEKKDTIDNLETDIKNGLSILEKKGIVSVTSEGDALKIIYLLAGVEELNIAYKKISEKPSVLFPSVKDGIKFENATEYRFDDLYEVVEDRNDLDSKDIVKVIFSSDLKEIFVLYEFVNKLLVQVSILKLQEYISNEKNYSYIKNKLNTVFKNNELSISNFLDGFKKDPGLVLRGIKKPSQTFFQLITKFYSILNGDYIANSNVETKTTMMLEDQVISAYILKSIVNYYRSLMQKKGNLDSISKDILMSMQKYPYHFTYPEISGFLINGKPVSSRGSREDIYSIISQHSRYSEGSYKTLIPLPMTDPTGNRGETVYIMKLVVCFFLNDKKVEIKSKMLDFYTESWRVAIYQKREFVTMRNKQKMQEHIMGKIQKEYPVVRALLNPDIVDTLTKDEEIDKANRRWLVSILDESSDIDVLKFLEINQKDLLESIKKKVPSSNPIVRFFANLFGKTNIDLSFDHEDQEEIVKKENNKKDSGKKDSSKSNSVKQSVSESNQKNTNKEKGNSKKDNIKGEVVFEEGKKGKTKEQKLEELAKEYSIDTGSLDKSLKELAKTWLPVIGSNADALIEDVNSLCQEALRKMQKGRRGYVPDKDGISVQIKGIIEADTLKDVRNQDTFKKYLATYFYKILK